MGIEFICPEFEVVRNDARCTRCRICEGQCANRVHRYDEGRNAMVADEMNCVNCQRCVSFCPTRALKIVRSDCRLRENANWGDDAVKEIFKQATSGADIIAIESLRDNRLMLRGVGLNDRELSILGISHAGE